MSATRDVALFCEGEAPASTGPLPWGPSVLHSSRACMDPANQPVGLGWVRALTLAAVHAHQQANGWEQS